MTREPKLDEGEPLAVLDEVLGRLSSPLAVCLDGEFSSYGASAWSDFERLVDEIDWEADGIEAVDRMYAAFGMNQGCRPH